MTKVFIIEQGEYSEYRVVGIFSTRENAEKVCAYLTDDEDYSKPEVVERILDPIVDELNQGLTQFYVRFLHSGETSVHRPKDTETEDMHWNAGDLYYAWARDSEHALKIAAEKHAVWRTTPKVEP